MNRKQTMAALAALGICASIAVAAPAVAEPSTTVKYPGGATTTRLDGYAFDTCTAPTVSAMQAWKSSPYTGVGVYIGGGNRTCAQPQLTVDWVGQVSRMGWKIVPIYMGRQAPCTFRGAGSINISPSTAEAQGVDSASRAITDAQAIGIREGSAIYGDMEHYDATKTACRTAVLKFLSGWTKELHRRGYLSGVYAHQNSGAKHLSEAYGSTSYARPDALWIARWDLNDSLTDWPTVSNTQWASGQRGKQYRGDHNETHGGVTINIDSDRFNAPVATVSYAYKVTSSTPLSARRGPSTSYSVVRTVPPGGTVYVRCQLAGSTVGSTKVWNRLNDGTYVTDYYVSTPSNTGYSRPLPRCALPYQVSSSGPLTMRTGPGSGYSASGSLHPGALARVICQTVGTTVGSTRVWDKLSNGRYVTDYYVRTPNKTTYSSPNPRC